MKQTLILALLVAGYVLPAAGQIPQASLFPPWPDLWSSYDTKPRDCHLAVVDPAGRKILVGVETVGDARTKAALQVITLIVNDKGFWSDPYRVSSPGTVYFPALAVDSGGRVWVAWSEFDGRVWKLMVRDWNLGRFGPPVELSGATPVNLQPTLAAMPSGGLFVAWEAAIGGRFEIRGRLYRNGQWLPAETISRGGMHEFRPAATVDSNGVLWIAWDRSVGSQYQTLARARNAQGWSAEMPVFPAKQNARVPQIAADGSGRVWVLASGQLAGLAPSGERFQLTSALPKWLNGPDFFTIDGKDRFWLFKSLADRSAFDWMAAWRNARMAMAVADAQGLHVLPEQDAALGYQPPHVDADGNVWAMNTVQLLRFAAPFQSAEAGASTRTAPLPAGDVSAPEPRAWPRFQIAVGGKTHQVYWAEMHNHLLEVPTDRVIASWIDRFYLTGRYRDGLDIVALTDHDWPAVTRSMYFVEHAIGNVLNAPGRFLAFNGFEWSGDSQTRARFGDRTVLFPDGYHDIPRITDDSANDSAKLSANVRRIGGLDWPHHIGRAESPVNPKFLNPETEPVMEMTSGHGVFETYDPARAVPIPYRTQIVPGTSAQDALATGKRLGMVGSSDSHSGFSGYPTGMFAVVATELTRAAILDAIRQKRTYAIRGGQPVLVDFRVDGHFIGEEFRSLKPPRVQVTVKAAKPIQRIEIVRNNRYVYVRDFDDAALDRTVEYQDTEPPPAYYYARISLAERGYAWTSPVWVNASAAPRPLAKVAGGLGLLIAAAVLFGRRRYSFPGSRID